MKLNQLRELVREEVENALKGNILLFDGSSSTSIDYPSLFMVLDKVLGSSNEMKTIPANTFEKVIDTAGPVVLPLGKQDVKFNKMFTNNYQSSFDEWINKNRQTDMFIVKRFGNDIRLATPASMKSSQNIQTGIDRMRQDSNSGLD